MYHVCNGVETSSICEIGVSRKEATKCLDVTQDNKHLIEGNSNVSTTLVKGDWFALIVLITSDLCVTNDIKRFVVMVTSCRHNPPSVESPRHSNVSVYLCIDL